MEDIKLNIGSNIRFFREYRGISQESLAMDLGISQQAIQQIETDKTKVTLRRANRIAQSLNVDLEQLLTHSPTNQFNNCSQSGIYNTYNLLSEKLLTQIEQQNVTLKEELEFLRQQNQVLLELVKEMKK